MPFFDEDEQQPDVTNIFNILNDAGARIEAEAKTAQVKDAILTAVYENPETVKQFLISLGVAINALVARRRIRQGLVAAGVDPKAAKAISLGLIWAAWAVAASATSASRYATYITDNSLYPETADTE